MATLTCGVSTGTEVIAEVNDKVNRDGLKVLSTNDYTNLDKTKLAGIESGAKADQTKVDIDALSIDAGTVGGLTVETAVPVGALFTDTDTVYDDTTLAAAVALNTLKVSNVNHPLVETAVPLGALFTDTDTVYDDTAIQAAVTLNTAKVSNVDHPLVETAVPVGALFTDTVYSDVAIQAEVDLNTAKVTYPSADSTKLAGIDAGAEVNTINSDVTGITGAGLLSNIITISQTNYDLLTPDANTFYVII